MKDFILINSNVGHEKKIERRKSNGFLINYNIMVNIEYLDVGFGVNIILNSN